jgi:hypothetical protein
MRQLYREGRTVAGHWNWAEDLVMRVQAEFLNTPGLTLTADAAARTFAIDRRTCDAVLAVLTEAGVLAEATQGLFTRRVPALAVRDVNQLVGADRGRAAARMSQRVSHAAA